MNAPSSMISRIDLFLYYVIIRYLFLKKINVADIKYLEQLEMEGAEKRQAVATSLAQELAMAAKKVRDFQFYC
jgi:hypothetical protein